METLTQVEIDELVTLFGAQRYAELERAAQTLLIRAPDAGFVWKVLSLGQKMGGTSWLAAAREAARLLPDDTDVHLNLGVALREQGLHLEAIDSYRRGLALNPARPDGHSSLANALADAGRFEEAVAHCRQALAIAPNHAAAWTNLGFLLQNLGQSQESADASRQAIALAPGNAIAHNNLANALRSLGQLAEAEAHYRHALQLQPTHTHALVSLAALLTAKGQPADAVACCRQALAVQPALAEAWNNLAAACKELQQAEAAEKAYRQALALKPDFAQAHYNLSFLLLGLGRYEEGWVQHEWRSQLAPSSAAAARPALASPPWQGEALAGRHIVLYHEQGYGDTIQFVRYAVLLKRLGAARVTLLCPPPLVALMGTASCIDEVCAAPELVPSHDCHVLTMSAPLHCATRVDNIPAPIPYLAADAARIRRWHPLLPAAGFRVGLVWKGSTHHNNDHYRSLPHLSTLAPLWQAPDVQFVSLQKGRAEDEAASPPPGQPLIALGDQVEDFSDAAAIINELDLVVTVDTAMAHLAGALGKRCWLLLPAYGTDWRWQQGRDNTPWYPMMRLYRQESMNDWQSVVERMAADLCELSSQR